MFRKIYTYNNGQGMGMASKGMAGGMVLLVGVAYKYLRWSWVLK